jgi:cellulose synthase/poly-beta-1,6-N-acetylglucosamine synthase-like glycosyltransferase
MIIEILFWISISLIIYTYVGYPLVTLIYSLFVKNLVNKQDIEPKVTFLITAYNEEKNVRQKLENTISLDYPKEKLEVMVASDGSTDKTDEIVKEFSDRGVILHRVEGRLGKTATQNSAVKISRGEIIVFSDAASMYDPGAIHALVKNYADPKVGAVSGMYNYLDENASSAGLGKILFWKLENFIKSRQTRIKTITGCCGCIYSVRKDLYSDLPPHIISDLVEPLTILKKGYRIVFEPSALALEETAGDTEEEFKMRIRVIVRGMNGMLFVRSLFNPFKYPFVSFQLISHKLLRWMVPIFAIFALISNAFLITTSPFYTILFFGQLIFYALAVIGYIKEKQGIHKKIFYLPLYFCTVNLASLISMFKVLRKENIVTWQTKR